MSDAPETALEGGAPTPAEADRPEEESSRDEVSEATPPNPEEGEDAPEAN
jgi:hypothetical protein